MLRFLLNLLHHDYVYVHKRKRKTFLISNNQKKFFSFAVKGLNTQQTYATKYIKQCNEHFGVNEEGSNTEQCQMIRTK